MTEHIITSEDSGIRLDRWFKRHMPELNHGVLEKALRKGLIRLDGKKSESSFRLEEGQVLRIRADSLDVPVNPRLRKKQVSAPEPSRLQALRRAILYEDERLLVLNKPAGLAVQGGSGQKNHVDGLLAHLGNPKQGALKLVHRLDKDTSGVLLLAKGAKSASLLSALFARKEVEKIYLALVVGVPKPREGLIDLPLLKGVASVAQSREKVYVDEENGQRAVTKYRVLDALGKHLAWVELRPVTGRTHQLRAHMAAIGCPIVGDGKYGGSIAFMKDLGLPEQLHLHAQRIVLPAWGGDRIDVSAPLPAHMKRSKNLLGE